MRHRSIDRMREAQPEGSLRRGLLKFAFLALVVQLPFELRYTFLGSSNLQWTLLVVSLLAVPELLRERKLLLSDRLVQAAILFVGSQWFAILFAPEFQTNAAKAAVRFTAGAFLLVLAKFF